MNHKSPLPTSLEPKDHAERVALFRAQVLGPLTCTELVHGDQAKLLRELSRKRFRPPGRPYTRSYGVSTLERWLGRYRKGGLEALRPGSRATGHAQALTKEQRKLIIAIRREYRGASVPVIMRTLIAEGRVEADIVTESAVRRLLASHGLQRELVARDVNSKEGRRRWQVERPGQLWHADVCHGPSMKINGKTVPLRIHGFLDDASRFVPVLAARSSEREVDMLELFVAALREHGPPKVLYLDNGSTYSGKILKTMCARLGITLLHAAPYDPQARGKQERFWRTLREGCLDFLGELSSLHDVQVRLLAFLDAHYHHAPHSGLLGRAPAKVWATRERMVLDEARLTEALTVRVSRKVRGDGTISVGGLEWELEDGWLSRQKVTVARSFADPTLAPWVEHEGKRLPLRLVDPIANSHRRRPLPKRARKGVDALDFDPNRVRIDSMLGRLPKGGGR
jgi:putative transposase